VLPPCGFLWIRRTFVASNTESEVMMRRLAVIVLVLLFFGLAYQPAARADSSIQDVVFNVNGAITQSAFPGIANVGGYDPATGLGSIVLTFNPGGPGGVFSVAAGFDLSVGNQGAPTVPFWNEFGATSGTPIAGQSWIVGTGASPNDPLTANQVFNAVKLGGNLGDTNTVPGQTNNYLQDCTAGAACNNDVALGMGFDFTLGAGQEAILTFNFSTNVPAGFYLSQTHPIDPDNATASTVYFTGTEKIQGGGPPPVSEPSSLLLFGSALAGLAVLKLRK
jgi:hypothetical protein